MISGLPLVAAGAHSGGSVEILVDVAIVLAMCVVFGLIARRLGQSVLVGYLLAGVLLGGPSSLGIVEDIGSFSFMGEVGIALLLFTVGLDLPFEKVRKFGRTALVAGGFQVVLTTLVAAAASVAFGLSGSTAFVVGFAVSLSSTAVVITVLADRSETDSVHGLVATGMLIAQDVVVVLVLVLIPLLPGAEGAGSANFAMDLLTAIGKLAAVTLAIFVTERIVLRRLFPAHGAQDIRELLAVSSLTISLGAIGACWALDLSPALGGFITGLIMADARYAPQVRSEIAPIRMGLVAVFFAYVGMLADAGWLLTNLPLVIAIVLLVIGGKALLSWISARIAQVPALPAILTAVALAQLGEFSFAVLTAGDAVGLIDDETFRVLVSVSLVSLLATPPLIAGTSRALHRRSLHLGVDGLPGDELPESAMSDHAIVVGAGPSGRAVTSALAEHDLVVTVIELNPKATTGSADDDLPRGTRVVFGDASRPEILQRAGVQTARIVVLTVPDPTAMRTVIAQCRQLVRDVPVIARGRYNRYIADLRRAGADIVVDEEGVTGRELADVALTRLAMQGLVERRTPTKHDRRGD